MSTVITVENLGKKYTLSHQQREPYTALRDVITNNFKNFSQRIFSPFTSNSSALPSTEDFWALKDVSFEVKQGDRIGIIGRNGAGKSTLLKILSRITEPTTGRVKIKGRVASLLEVGTGFHPELTGRENIFLNGAILGMGRAEIKKKFDEIVDFAEIEKFLDTPVKRYSSGMYVRLAFAVAAHLEPEILIVDEVLAVGDAQFQKKCLGKMEDVSAKEGRTVLFVSHNMGAVQSLCRTGIVLSRGYIQYIGSQLDAVSAYLVLQTSFEKKVGLRNDRLGTQEVRVESIVIVNGLGQNIERAISGQEIGIRLYFSKTTKSDFRRIIASVSVKTQFGIPVFMIHSRLTGDSFGGIPEEGCLELRIPNLPLPSAVYHISFSLMQDGTYIDFLDDASELTVSDGDFFGTGEIPPSSHGVCLCHGHWSLHR